MQIVPVNRTNKDTGQEEVTVTFRAESDEESLYSHLLARGRKVYDYWANPLTPAPVEPPDRIQRATAEMPSDERTSRGELIAVSYDTARFVTITDPATGEERLYTEPVTRIRFDLMRHPIVAATCYRAEDLPLFFDLLQMLGVQEEEADNRSELSTAGVTLLEEIRRLDVPLDGGQWWNAVFRLYHRYNETYRTTLKELAEITGYGYDTVKKRHALWRNEHE